MITKKEFEFLIEKRINPTEQNNNKNLQPLMVNLIKDHVEYIKDLKEEFVHKIIAYIINMGSSLTELNIKKEHILSFVKKLKIGKEDSKFSKYYFYEGNENCPIFISYLKNELARIFLEKNNVEDFFKCLSLLEENRKLNLKSLLGVNVSKDCLENLDYDKSYFKINRKSLGENINKAGVESPLMLFIIEKELSFLSKEEKSKSLDYYVYHIERHTRNISNKKDKNIIIDVESVGVYLEEKSKTINYLLAKMEKLSKEKNKKDPSFDKKLNEYSRELDNEFALFSEFMIIADKANRNNICYIMEELAKTKKNLFDKSKINFLYLSELRRSLGLSTYSGFYVNRFSWNKALHTEVTKSLIKLGFSISMFDSISKEEFEAMNFENKKEKFFERYITNKEDFVNGMNNNSTIYFTKENISLEKKLKNHYLSILNKDIFYKLMIYIQDFERLLEDDDFILDLLNAVNKDLSLDEEGIAQLELVYKK
ncbi:MAG: hypothetical protein CL760_01880 [Chloroflexi bacterium]|nr:hypothetical protein [Chloroflexota bacterium]|tara:strand:- start:5657 stop:7102 length:1446 start_codon:yes stop_codon:yes gene_type:complete